MKKFAQYALSLGLTALFGYMAFADVEVSALWVEMQRASPLSLGAIVVVTLVRIGLRTWRWQLMMRQFAAHIGFVATYMAVAICYGANVVVPRSGDVLRAVVLGWSDKMPLAPMLGSVVAERVFDVLLLVLLAGAVFSLVTPAGAELYPQLAWSLPLGIAAVGLALGVMMAFAAGRYELVVRALRRVSPRLAALVEPHITALALGMGALRNPHLFATIAAVSLLMHLGYAGLLYVGFWGFGLTETYALGTVAALTTMVVSAVAFFVPTPAGIGPYHFFFKEALTTFYGVPPTEALACATIVHVTYNVTYLVVGGGAAVAVQIRRFAGERAVRAGRE